MMFTDQMHFNRQGHFKWIWLIVWFIHFSQNMYIWDGNRELQLVFKLKDIHMGLTW